MSSWCCAYVSGPMAFSVCFRSSTGERFENWPTLSWGRNWSGLSTWMLSDCIFSLTAALLTFTPFIFHSSLLWMSKSRRTTRLSPGALPSTSSVSTKPRSIRLPRRSLLFPSPCTQAEILSPRSVTLSGPPSPTHMAQTMLDFPVPLGPMMQLSRSPGSLISASVYDMKLCNVILAICPRREESTASTRCRFTFTPLPSSMETCRTEQAVIKWRGRRGS
mmetsp:Transcript_8089/g.20047  ORF Transcript_8089/g.20047 Transcript_8089/m.20047 type:complete len:219 (+) Transcript_8089:2218-2874(+)